MDARQKTLELLRKFKCPLVRGKRHNVYLLPSGQPYTLPITPSDHHCWPNCLSDLRIALGISRRGKTAKVRKPSPKVRRKPKARTKKDPLTGISAAPRGFDFREKVRAALRGEKLTNKEPEPLPPVPEPPKKERFRAPRRLVERERHGAVRVWSKADIEAANLAMRVGKLGEFVNRHYAASRPEVEVNQPNKEESTMLAVEQIDATIRELDEGMAAAREMAATERANITRLETETEQARQRMLAADDKQNSLQDVKNSLAIVRGDIERIRPMLGLLAHKPAATPITGKGIKMVSATGLVIRDVMKQIFSENAAPLRVNDILNRVHEVRGF